MPGFKVYADGRVEGLEECDPSSHEWIEDGDVLTMRCDVCATIAVIDRRLAVRLFSEPYEPESK